MASNALTQQVIPQDASALEKVLLQGDLSSLRTDERIQYYRELCASLDLNPLTKPFEYLEMKGQGGKNILTLYAKKDCTDQLRNKRRASSKIVSREVVEGVYVVTAQATTPEGRQEESIGAVPIVKEGGRWATNEDGRKEFRGDGTFIPLRPEERANAMMKAESKAKRRATLSLFGLGFVSEEEAEGISDARKVSVEDAHGGRLLAAPKETGQGKQTHTRDAEPGTGAGVAEKPAAPVEPKLDPRPIPEELRAAVGKMRLGEIAIIGIVDAMFKREFTEACGSEDLYTAETTAFRKQYPKGAKWPYEAMVSLWLDAWAVLESCKFANSANPETV